MFFLALYFLYVAVLETIGVINLEKKYDDLLSRIITNIFTVLKFTLDVYLYWLFSRDFLYFYKLFKEKVEIVTRFNIFILVWAFTLMLLSFSHSLYAFLDNSHLIKLEEWVVRTIDRNYIPSKDFLISSTMLYLFYYQSTNSLKAKKVKQS